MVTAQGRDNPQPEHGHRDPRVESASGEGLRRGEVGIQELPGANVEAVLEDGVPEGGFGWAGGPGGMGWAGPGGTGTSRWPLATLFYGEYKNTYGRRGGDGEEGEVAGVSRAEGGQRGGPFHGMERFIQGKPWIADAGVPFWPGLIKYP